MRCKKVLRDEKMSARAGAMRRKSSGSPLQVVCYFLPYARRLGVSRMLPSGCAALRGKIKEAAYGFVYEIWQLPYLTQNTTLMCCTEATSPTVTYAHRIGDFAQ
jgi:hypothetical protein